MKKNEIKKEEKKKIMPVPRVMPTYIGDVSNIEKDALHNSIDTYIFVWLKPNKDNETYSFWMMPTKVTEMEIFGYCFNGYDWGYCGFLLDDLQCFY